MSMILAIAAMRVEHRNIPSPEGLAPDVAIEVIQALHPAAHQCAQQERSVAVEGDAEHGRDGEDDMPIDHPLVEDLTPLAHPGVNVDFGTPQAPGRCAAHPPQVLALAAVQAAIFEVAHLLRVATVEHLSHEAIVV